MEPARPLRVGIIKFINSVPLYAGLERHAQILFDTPKNLAAALDAGQVEAAFVPSVHYLRHRGRLHLVRNVSISSFGPVTSVRLVYRGHLESLHSVVESQSSITSNFVARIVLRERHGLTPRFLEAGTRELADARVVIGDDALALPDGEPFLDLGTEWFAMTGLPLVYAVCAARTEAVAGRLGGVFERLKRDNLANLPGLLRGLRLARHEAYVRNICYDLDQPHHDSLDKLAGFLRTKEPG